MEQDSGIHLTDNCQKAGFPSGEACLTAGSQQEKALEKAKQMNAEINRFSLFKRPISNVYPHSEVTLGWVHNLIRGDYYKEETEALRSLDDPALAREYKSQNFDYVTFSGTFSQRGAKYLVQHSGYLCLDFDHLEKLTKMREKLLSDQRLKTALIFKSPGGQGLKCIVEIDLSIASHEEWFNGVKTYLRFEYGVEIDPSGRDTCRACFLSYDPEAYINPKYIL